MATPTGGDATIYGAKAKRHELRFVVGFTERYWESAFSATFGSDVSPSDWRTTQWGGRSVQVSGGRALFNAYGGPTREELITREHAYPREDLATKTTIVGKVLEADPVYGPMFCVGGIDGIFGVESNPLWVFQQGSADTAEPAHYGQYAANVMASIHAYSYDTSDHTWEVLWDPNGSPKLTVKRDSSTIASSSDEGYAVRPRFVQLGVVRGVTKDETGNLVEGLGTPDVPTLIMSIDSVTVEENGDGYETRTFPAWSTANAGATSASNAAVGERWTEDGVQWAKMPLNMIKSGGGWGSSRRGVIRPSLTLSVAGGDSGDYGEDRWIGRTIRVESRYVNDAESSQTSWRCLGVLTVEDVEEDDDGVRLTLIDRVAGRFDVPMARSYVGEDADGSALGTIEASNVGYSLGEIIEDMLDVADTHAGGLIPTTDRRVNMPVIFPSTLNSAGDSLLSVAQAVCDRVVQQMCTRYTTSGWGKYGGLMVNVWDLGTGTAGWTFQGRGGTSGGSMVVPPGYRLMRSGRGPSQVFYRNDNPNILGELRSQNTLPLAGVFPTGAHPSVGRELDDSMALSQTNDGFSTQTAFPSDDEDAIDRLGGPAYLRWWKETLARRRVSFSIYGHDWMEVGDEIAINDPDGRGITTAETWVIDSVTYTLDGDGEMKAAIEVTTTSLDRAISSTV